MIHRLTTHCPVVVQRCGGMVPFILGAVILSLLVASCSDDSSPIIPPSGNGNCIDYADYMHIAGSVGTPGDASDVVVSGDYAYVADGASGLLVIDLSTPASPVIMGSVGTSRSAASVAVSGDYVCVAVWDSGLQVVKRQCEPGS